MQHLTLARELAKAYQQQANNEFTISIETVTLDIQVAFVFLSH